ncbi:MAG: DEAD/DEAH box helicase [Thermodesulfobacteriota bacterium]
MPPNWSRPTMFSTSWFATGRSWPTRPAEAAAGLTRLLSFAGWQDEPLQEPPDHLRPYQRHGLAWLAALARYGLGGILADDLGLGKTHQALALVQQVLRHGSGRRVLVVAPTSVVPHWVDKIRSFYPDLSVWIHHGGRRHQAELADQALILTTYGILRQDAELFAGLRLDLVLLDEAQNLKSARTEVYAAASRLQARVVLGLTGTPVENSVWDLKALFDLCLPGLLGSNAHFGRLYGSAAADDGASQHRQALARLVRPFILRRSRQQVLTELPAVIEDVRLCELADDQVKLYRDAIEARGRSLAAQLADADADRLPYLEILTLIGTLKAICNHPCLVEGSDDLERYGSGKWDLFVEILEECLEAGLKVVVFSQYTRMLDLIVRHLDRIGVAHAGLRGEMVMSRRQEEMRRFQEDPEVRVFCASLLAGGTGIDLTAAQAVIHYDRWWNAAREEQATARVHRMGQRSVVQVFKLITTGTLEEKIHRLIEDRRQLAATLVQEDDAAIMKGLSRQDLAELLAWQGAG